MYLYRRTYHFVADVIQFFGSYNLNFFASSLRLCVFAVEK